MGSEKGSSSQKPASINDVAKMAGVSVGTVSHALNNIGYVKKETREKIENAAKQLNYIPNRAGRILKTNQTKMVMLAIPDTSNEIYFGMIEGVLKTLKSRGYSMLLYYTNAMEEEELHAIRLLEERLIDGLILVHFSYSDALLEELKKARASGPVVLIGMCNHLWAGRNYPLDTVSIDIYSGIYEVVKHLIRIGHRKIGYLAGRQGIEVYAQRYRAYRQALEDYGISYREEYVRWGDFTESGGYSGGRELYMMEDRPTAICGSNDLQSIGCYEAIKDLGGKVSNTVALTGVDNLNISRILGITSLNMREKDMGEVSAKMILEHILDGNENYQDVYFKPELNVRDSSMYYQVPAERAGQSR